MIVRPLAFCCLFIGLTLSQYHLAAAEPPVWTPIGPAGGDVQALAVSPILPDVILAGVPRGAGIFRSSDRGQSWKATDGEAGGRNILDLAVSADGKAFYAAAHQGLFKSTDGGLHWTALDGGGQGSYLLVATHPVKPDILFALWGGTLVRSADGGLTRQTIDGPIWVSSFAFAPSGQGTTTYAGAQNGLWKSVDDGLTWSQVSLPLAAPVESVAVDPARPKTLYLGLRHTATLLLKSVDGGATWRVSQTGLPAVPPGEERRVSRLAVDRTKPSHVYAAVQGELFRSTNGGRSWARPTAGPLPGGSVNALQTTGYGVLAGTQAGVLLSTDRGLTWQLRVRGLSAYLIHGLTIDRQQPGRLYASAGTAGLFKTATRGQSWLRLGNVALPQNGAQPLAVDPVDSNVVYAGSDAALARSTSGGRRWTLQRFGSFLCVDFQFLAFDPRDSTRFFASGQNRCPYPGVCNVVLSRDGGESWSCLSVSNQLTLLGIEPFGSVLYALGFGSDLLRSTDSGSTWVPIQQGFSVQSFAASPRVEGTLWAGQGAAVARSRDGGATWQAFATGLPADESVIALAPDPVDPETLYAGTLQRGVLKSTDAGETWSPVGLWPQGVLLLGNLLVDPEDPDVVYAATDSLGVLRLDQNGSDGASF